MIPSRFKSFARVFVGHVCKDALSWLAFSLLLAWMFGLYWSNLFVGKLTAEAFDFLQLRALWLGVEALVLLGMFALHALGVHQRFVSLVVAGSCLFVGTTAILFVPMGQNMVVLVGVGFTGVGSALALLEIGVGFAHQGPQRLLLNVAVALAAASILDGILLVLPPVLQPMVVSLLPAVCVSLLVLAKTKQTDAQAPVLGKSGLMQGKRKAMVRLVALPFIVGVAYGLMQRLTIASYIAESAEVNAATIVSFFISALFIGIAALFFDSTKLTKLMCFVAIPIVGIAFVALPLFANAREAAQSICIVGFNSFYFMVWALWSGRREDGALAKRFALGLFVLVGSESLGSLLGLPIIEVGGASGETLAVVSLIVVYLLLMAGIFSFDRSEGVRGGASSDVSEKGEEPMPALGGREFALDVWAARYGLSARETEVFDLLAKGRNRSYVSKTLFISDNTTRTHMKNIYRKLGVHSHQELIDLLEQGQGQ